MKDISASIVIHNPNMEQLDKAIDSVLACVRLSTLIIVDNSTTDRLRQHFSQRPGVEYLYVENRGFGAAHNIAIRMAATRGMRYHVIVNPDVRWSADAISVLARYMDGDERIGVCSPKTFYPSGKLQHTCRMLPTPLDLIAKRFLPHKLFEKRMSRYMLDDFSYDEPLNVPYLLGSFMLFRIDALKEVGLFDERFFMYPEDIDITRRLHRKYLTMFSPLTYIYHDHEAASTKSKRMLMVHICNMCRYFNKWGWFSDKERRLYNARLSEKLNRKA